MNIGSIADYLQSEFSDVVAKNAWGETSFFVNPNCLLPSGTYFATLKEKDGENDQASDLDRPGIFRLNFGPGKPAFVKAFGAPPARPGKGCIIEGPWQFTDIDVIMPHPVYGWMGWMCILNPSRSNFDYCKDLLATAHQKASLAVYKRLRKEGLI